jgi:hypothetical protein
LLALLDERGLLLLTTWRLCQDRIEKSRKDENSSKNGGDARFRRRDYLTTPLA